MFIVDTSTWFLIYPLIILTLFGCRYASAIERNPEDHDALYNWALVLQVCS